MRLRGLGLRHIIQAELALKSDETPVGCVFVHKDQIIARGMNDTNRSLNVRYSRRTTV